MEINQEDILKRIDYLLALNIVTDANEIVTSTFSIIEFYLRRTRRIMPLALFICLVALAVGVA